MDHWTPITDLIFNGSRFAGASVELEVVQELASFQRLVTELSADLYFAKHFDRERLPKGFDAETRLRFNTIAKGSAVFPLEAPVQGTDGDTSDSLFGPLPSPFVAQAIELIREVIRSQDLGEELPARFPRDRVTELSRWGSTLSENESITVSESGRLTNTPKRATFTIQTKARLKEYSGSYYEDVVTLMGDVRLVDLDRSISRIRLSNHTAVDVRFNSHQQSLFTGAQNQGTSVSVTGLAEISRIDGMVSRIVTVTDVAFLNDLHENDETSFLAWAVKNPSDAWSRLPHDFSTNLDKYVYGRDR